MSDLENSFFSDNYATARSRFCAKASEKGATLHRLPLSAKGPDDLDLSIDIAIFGNPKPQRVVLHSSGLHGVEGFAGSAIQLKLMDTLPQLPEDAAVVFAHILNPYGMAWLRRVNESNVDLNRNFLSEDEAYNGAPLAYQKLDSMLNPESTPGFDFFLLRTTGCILRYGYNSLKQAIVGGQYEYPKGLFFGGSTLEEGPRRYSEWLTEHLGSTQHVVAIDIHTGLGKSGEDTLLVEGEPDSLLYKDLQAVFGERVAPWDPDQGVAYAIKGGHPNAVERVISNGTVHFVTQEFGTLAPLKVLHALREENRWHHWGTGELDHASKKSILAAFRPDHPNWKTSIIRRGDELAQQSYRLAFSNS